jgi:hypothetical protein
VGPIETALLVVVAGAVVAAIFYIAWVLRGMRQERSGEGD